MVHQPAADAGHIGPDVDAERPKLGLRANAGAKQVRRRVNGATAQDDSAGAEFQIASLARSPDPDAAIALEDQLRDVGIG